MSGARTVRPGTRLAWLDALRGFAALAVVFDHGTYLVFQQARQFVYHWFDPGQYGVFVFFLVSGYIVPASLERKGSVRAFWISRVFRLYPLFVVAIVVSVLGYLYGFGNVAYAQLHPLTAAGSWLLMLSNILSGPNVPNVVWTLSFEMVFYLVLTALFTWRVHRHSGGYALGCALGAFALGGVLPMMALYRAAHGLPGHQYGGGAVPVLDYASDAAIIIGIAAAVLASGKANPWPARIGASLAALVALVLVNVNNSYPYPWSGFTILALMFTGTLIYRAGQGQTSKRTAAVIAAAVLVLTIGAGAWHGHDYGRAWLYQWVSSLVLAGATFGAGLLLKNRKLPAPLAWLGLVSYSVYLLHPLVLDAYMSIVHKYHQSLGMQAFLALGILAAILAVSAVGYYAIEKPMQRAGRWLTARTRDPL